MVPPSTSTFPLAAAAVLVVLGSVWLCLPHQPQVVGFRPRAHRPEMAAARAFGQTIIQPARAAHTGTVIMLHGLGDTGDGWAPVGPQLSLSHVKWVYPTAPTRPITVNGGYRMPGWFDLASLDLDSFQQVMSRGQSFDAEGVAESVQYVSGLIAEEIRSGTPASRIVLGGFSQGGHIALRAALTHAPRLAGCAALSTWLEPAQIKIPEGNLDLPVLVGHGSTDPLIPAVVANLTQDVLHGYGLRHVDFKLYPGMQHSTCPQELADLRAFLLRVLPEQTPTPDAVRAWSARELKQFLQSRGISTAGLLEKSELLEKALGLLDT